MSQFRKMNIIGGWTVFAVAFITYLLTIEPTASLWDCGEFIATSYKLEVGHPPGTPFFFLINRLGAMFAPEPADVAVIINGLSALESALTIAFLFWSISHLARRIYTRDGQELTAGQDWAVIAAAAIGSLAYTFSDTFWFSAVEAEVYALSSLFTAVVFWAILKWEEVADRPGSNRWLILIAYLMGLSIGAHILNLLAIPAIVFIFYFKKFPDRPKAQLWKPAVAALVLLGAFYSITPTVISIGAFVDRIFVNSLGMPFNSGLAVFVALLLCALGYGIYRTQIAGRATLNAILVSAAMVVVGFSTYGIVLIRASVNPPMNSNNPDNPYALLSFINREQYEQTPLTYGQTYATPGVETIYKKSYYDADGKYAAYEKPVGTEYDQNGKMLFPRMYSADPNHVKEYEIWGKVQGHRKRMGNGEMATIPTFGENLRFFFSYQLNFMYWRYFLWNFVVRQNDVQSAGGILDGNWMSGVEPVDQLYLGPQEGMPAEMAANKARNKYFFLPFILGLIGLFFQLKRDGKNFLVVMLLFFMTGLAIIVYLNQPPLQPRERDYAYAGSFYAYAIWIGLGLLPVFNSIVRAVKNHKAAAIAAALVCGSVPAIMAVENWDDHNRSGRTIARDIGYAYLDSTLPNSVLINYGDNDTFPVWYAQEVEGFRTDVRVMNFSYISGSWYFDQMRIRANESAPLPLTLKRDRYTGGTENPYFPVLEVAHPRGKDWTGKEVMAIVNSDEDYTKVEYGQGEKLNFIPTRKIAIPVNKENVLASGIVKPEDAHLIEDTIYITLRKNYLTLADMAVLDLISSSDWTRPIHFTSAAGLADFGMISYADRWSYLQQDGAAYRLVPIKTVVEDVYGMGRIDPELLYDNLMNKFNFGNIQNKKVYVDSFVEDALTKNLFRLTFSRLAKQLTAAGDTVRAVQVLDRCLEALPPSQLKYDYFFVSIIEAYWKCGEKEKGDALADELSDMMFAYLRYFLRFRDEQQAYIDETFKDKLNILYSLHNTAILTGNTERLELLSEQFNQLEELEQLEYRERLQRIKEIERQKKQDALGHHEVTEQ